MRKLLCSGLVLLLLFALAVPAGARDQDVTEILLAHVIETGDIPLEEIQYREVYKLHLRHLDMTLLVLTWFSEGAEKGQLAWFPAEERIVEADELQQLMEEEFLREQQEWEQMQQQAGNIDVWLYRQLLELDGEQEVEIVLLPRFNPTPQLEEALKDLFARYDLEYSEDVYRSWLGIGAIFSDLSVSSPDRVEGAVESGEEVVGHDVAEPVEIIETDDGREPALMPMPEPVEVIEPDDGREPSPMPIPEPVKIIEPDDGREPAPMPIPEPEPWWDEFAAELEELLAEGFREAVAAITGYLDQLGAQYQVHSNMVYTTLPAAMVFAVAELPDVAYVFSHFRAEIMPVLDGQEFTADLAVTGTRLGTEAEAGGSLLGWLVAGGLLAAAAGVLVYVKGRKC